LIRRQLSFFMPNVSPKKFARALGALFALATLATAIVVFIPKTGNEPSWQGRRLTWWLEQLAFNPSARASATTAIRGIGTNAIPALLTMLSIEDPPLRRKIMRLSGRQSLFHLTTSDEYHLMARNGFCVLGRMARPRCSAIGKTLKRPRPGYPQERALRVFRHCGRQHRRPPRGAINPSLIGQMSAC
jgi:hypothetical protein